MGSYILQESAELRNIDLPIYIPRGEIYMNKNPIGGIIEPIQLLEKGTLEDSGATFRRMVYTRKLVIIKSIPKIWVKSFIQNFQSPTTVHSISK